MAMAAAAAEQRQNSKESTKLASSGIDRGGDGGPRNGHAWAETGKASRDNAQDAINVVGSQAGDG